MGHNAVENITITADDGNGNIATCQFTVTLIDNTLPTIGCPGDQMLIADAGCQNVLPDYSGMSVLSDNCTQNSAITVTQMPAAGTVLMNHNDIETVTLTADDGNGNTATCQLQ